MEDSLSDHHGCLCMAHRLPPTTGIDLVAAAIIAFMSVNACSFIPAVVVIDSVVLASS